MNKQALVIRIKAALTHLGICILVAAACALLVFKFWFPAPYATISGGTSLFWLVISVDVVLGPVLTFVAFNREKTKAHLNRDLATIAVIQLAALLYGLHSVYLARPIGLVFEVDRFRAVVHADVKHDELSQAPPEFRVLSLTGPRLMGVREPANLEEKNKALELSLNGFERSMRPSFWVNYEESAKAALARARPAAVLLQRYPDRSAEIKGVIERTGRTQADFRFLPVVGRADNWVVLMDAKTGNPEGFVEADGFF
jgi:hypothetical protein